MNKMDRHSPRGVTRRAFAGALAGGLASAGRLRAQSKPPNILFIVTSQHRGDALMSAGHALVQTPVIDLLVKNGAMLSNVYSASPASAPARASLLTGKYPAGHGVTDAAEEPPSVEGALPELLRERGYSTWLAGRYGLARGASVFDAKYEFPIDYTPELRDKHPVTEGDPYDTGAMVESPLWRYGASITPFADFPTHRITDEAIGFIEGADAGKPWFVMAGYAGPQPPFVLPMPWNQRYPLELAALPELPEETPTPETPGGTRPDYALLSDSREVQAVRAHYFGAISFIDEQISRILRTLTKTDQINDTLVVFTSDHGLMLGEHGRMFASVPYDGALHVPAVFYWRERIESARIRNVVDTTSIVPTIFDIAGLEAPDGLEGSSVTPLVLGETDQGPEAAFAHLGFRTVRTRDWKLTLPGEGPVWEPQLFHLAEDPGETENLIDAPEAAKARKDLESLLKRGLRG